MVVIKSTINPPRNAISALSSSFGARGFLLRSARKESKQLVIKNTIAIAAPSSIADDSDSFETFTDVNTIKQKPNKLADVFKICGALGFSDVDMR